MSKFEERSITCRSCSDTWQVSVAQSINADRSPHHRDAIIAEQFHRFECPRCGVPAFVEDPFIYIDFSRREWIGVFPTSFEGEWSRWEEAPLQALRVGLGSDAPPIVQPLAEGLKVRVVFGLLALREKLVCFQAGLDDGVLEVMKLELMKGVDGLPVHPAFRPRLVQVDDTFLYFRGQLREGEGRVWGQLRVPRSQLARYVPGGPLWEVREQMVGGPYVDLGRIFMVPTQAQAAGS